MKETTNATPRTAHPVHVYRSNGRAVLVYADGQTERANAETLQNITADESNPATVRNSARDVLADIEREARQEAERAENFRRCKATADELDELAAGALIMCPHCGAILSADFSEDEDGESVQTCSECGETFTEDESETATAWDYFRDCLDIEYITDNQKQYKSIKICIAWGGPSIYIDTDAGAVCLYWWGESARAYLSTAARDLVDEWGAEVFDC